LVTRVVAVSLARAAVAIGVVTFGGREPDFGFPDEAGYLHGFGALAGLDLIRRTESGVVKRG
jgi:hypothetical protein